MGKLIIAVCILGIVVVCCSYILTWDRPGKVLTREKRSHRRLLEELRRHGEQQEGR